MRGIIGALLPDEAPRYNVRPPWLRNPKSNARLELDIFYPTLNLAFEYNGWQHNTVWPAKGVGLHEVARQRQRDKVKYRQAAEHGVHLYVLKVHDLSDGSLPGRLREWIEKARRGDPPSMANVGPMLEVRNGKTQDFQQQPKPRTQRLKNQQPRPPIPARFMHTLTPYDVEYLARQSKKHRTAKQQRHENTLRDQLAKRLERLGDKRRPARV